MTITKLPAAGVQDDAQDCRLVRYEVQVDGGDAPMFVDCAPLDTAAAAAYDQTTVEIDGQKMPCVWCH